MGGGFVQHSWPFRCADGKNDSGCYQQRRSHLWPIEPFAVSADFQSTMGNLGVSQAKIQALVRVSGMPGCQVFGTEGCSTHNARMMNTATHHQPFAELPLEARPLFYIYASAALARYQSHAPTTRELFPELEIIWNTHRLSQGDLTDPFRMTRFLEQHLAPSWPNQAAGMEKPVIRRRCKEA